MPDSDYSDNQEQGLKKIVKNTGSVKGLQEQIAGQETGLKRLAAGRIQRGGQEGLLPILV